GRAIFGPREYRPNTPYVAGMDLDKKISDTKWLPNAIINHWPISNGDYASVGGLTITAESDCGTRNTLVDVCTFKLNQKTQLCAAKSPVEEIDLLAVNATYADNDGGTTDITLGGNNTILACDTSFPEGGYPTPDTLPSWDKTGSLGKCLY